MSAASVSTRRAINGRRRRGRRAQPRLERVRVAAAPPHVRRRRPPRGRERPDRARGQRLVPRSLGLHGGSRLLRRPSRRGRRARDHLRGRPPAADRQRRVVDRLGLRRRRRRPVRRSDDRRQEAHPRLVHLRHHPRADDAHAPAGVRHRPAGALPRPAGHPSGGGRAHRGVALADRAHPRGLRSEPGGLGSVHRPRTPGRRDPGAARGGAGERGAGRPAAPHARRPPTGSSSAATTTRSSRR